LVIAVSISPKSGPVQPCLEISDEIHVIQLDEFKAKLKSAGSVDWPNKPALEFFWCFEMSASRNDVWTYISDTSRFNREVGMAPRESVEQDGKVLVRTSLAGFQQSWIERPWQWIYGETISSTRDYIKGIAKQVHAVFHISETTDQSRRLVYIYFGWKPSNRICRLFLALTSGLLKRKFATIFAKIDAHFQASHVLDGNALESKPPGILHKSQLRLEVIRAQLSAPELNLNSKAIDLLCEYVATADDMDLEPLRLKPLARKWKLPLGDVVATGLHATQLGMLKLSWNVICPHCRASRFSAETLGDIPDAGECTVCDVSFKTDDADSIEVVFHVQKSIRHVEELLFCAAEPSKKLHIKVQQNVTAQAELSLNLKLNDGLYRARWIGGSNDEFQISVNDDAGIHVLDLKEPLQHDTPRRLSLKSPVHLKVKNLNSEDRLFVLEELWWHDNALKPADVLALPQFRNLFSEEHLSSDVKLYLGEQTILFTDIVGSTKFYSKVGDAKAFAEVRSHFQEVFRIVNLHHGVVVKTIGDAVMGSFPSIEDAVRASAEIQRRFAYDREDTSIRLRVSIHNGPVIAVHLNNGIDYFGNTVNFAAKIQATAGAGEVVMCEMVYNKISALPEFNYPSQIRQNSRDLVEATNLIVLKISSESEKQNAAKEPAA
jgi:class 3 adenylate cyclase